MPLLNGHSHKGASAPRRAPRILNVLEQRFNASFYEAIAAIMALRSLYLQDRHIFVRGEDMVPILRGLGAREDDFEAVQHISDLTGPDPTLDYRTVTYGRYCVDAETRSLRRLETQPYTLTVQEDYRRHDSGVQRVFDEAPTEMQGNTVVQALLLFKAMVIHGVPVSHREGLDYGSRSWVTIMFNARTHTSRRDGLQGEPALEGVHSDGSDHTMTTFLGSDNMSAGSAVTYLHDLGERTGANVWETDPTLIRGRVQHRRALDTLLFADRDFKHSVTALHQHDEGMGPATRDMLVVFTRRPKTEGHISGYADTFDLHPTAPLHLPLWLP
ncbi:hypothetical protein N3K66_005175 [Trichothecium roseum]|uniref:Uncharacterized protein n=1 Tax=Trichothecium roseum TaxID=47278 RepID=A0ACC0V511_9HYPO|nr:hypothetical protein N3K66_005175 [Trichothecium roseum]